MRYFWALLLLAGLSGPEGFTRFLRSNGDGVTLLSGSQNITTSYTANNGVAAGMLKVVASQDAEDAVSFSGDGQRIILGHLDGTVEVREAAPASRAPPRCRCARPSTATTTITRSA